MRERFPTSDVDESVPWDGAIFAVEVEVEKSTLPVTVIKLIANVPAQRAKLLPLLRHRDETHIQQRATGECYISRHEQQ